MKMNLARLGLTSPEYLVTMITLALGAQSLHTIRLYSNTFSLCFTVFILGLHAHSTEIENDSNHSHGLRGLRGALGTPGSRTSTMLQHKF